MSEFRFSIVRIVLSVSNVESPGLSFHLSKIVSIVKIVQKLSKIVIKCQKLSKKIKIVKNGQFYQKLSNLTKLSTKIVIKNCHQKLSSKNVIKIFKNCQVMSPHHSDQMSQWSQVSRIALLRCSLNVFVLVIVIVFVFVFVFVFVIVFFWVMSCPLIALIKCLKGHKSLGWLFGGAL